MDLFNQPHFVFAAVAYSLVYLPAGGEFAGAIIVFVIAKMLGKPPWHTRTVRRAVGTVCRA